MKFSGQNVAYNNKKSRKSQFHFLSRKHIFRKKASGQIEPPVFLELRFSNASWFRLSYFLTMPP